MHVTENSNHSSFAAAKTKKGKYGRCKYLEIHRRFFGGFWTWRGFRCSNICEDKDLIWLFKSSEVAVIKYSDNRDLRKEEFILTDCPRLQSIRMGRSQSQKHDIVDGIAATAGQSRKMNTGAGFTFPLLFNPRLQLVERCHLYSWCIFLSKSNLETSQTSQALICFHGHSRTCHVDDNHHHWCSLFPCWWPRKSEFQLFISLCIFYL